MCSLTDQTILLTGATGGIGKAIAKRLIADGANVAISGTSTEKLEALQSELGGNVTPIACNLSDKDAVAGLVAQAEEKLGGLTGLICNAGITKDGLAMRMSNDDFEQVLAINLTASFILMRSALKGMMKRKSGRMIAISSVVGVAGNPGQANYVASKAGLIGLVKSMAQEVASRNITVNAIAPGFIESPMTEALTDAQREAMLQNIPMKSFGTPQDIAGATAFLASEDSRYITGQTLHINGGMLMV